MAHCAFVSVKHYGPQEVGLTKWSLLQYNGWRLLIILRVVDNLVLSEAQMPFRDCAGAHFTIFLRS